MGLFDWLFGKKSQGGSVLPPPSQPGDLSRPLSGIDALLQRCKELPPSDSNGAAILLREMLQSAVQAPSNSAGLAELNMALDSMVRHYPEVVQRQALEHPEPAVRERAFRLLRERNQLNGQSGEGKVDPSAENIRRWRQSAAPAWVEARRGQWNHQDWVDLLDSLRRSEYWPMNPDAIGLTLEELKREYQARRR